jgi:DNA (cytosine-5)-methyltransferase 1
MIDLFCKAGGASVGYHRAGFEVVGVDIEPQPHYPFEFIQADALDVLADREFLADFDAVAGSPPCQSESDLRHRWPGNEYPDLLTPTLSLLEDVRIPWVVENVASTRKLPGSLVLCGTEFGLKARCRDGTVRWLRRHRRFGASFFIMGAGGCHCARRPIGGVYGTGGGGQMNRGYKFHAPEGRQAMGIDWMTWPELSQAIPPAFTEHIGSALLAHLEVTR